MNPEVTQAFLEYEQLKLEVKRMETRMNELKPVLTANINEGEVINGRQGTFVLKKKTSWVYSAAVDLKETELDELKAQEEAMGKAKSIEKTFIEYRAKAGEEAAQ